MDWAELPPPAITGKLSGVCDSLGGRSRKWGSCLRSPRERATIRPRTEVHNDTGTLCRDAPPPFNPDPALVADVENNPLRSAIIP
jgi:hypothetical protein